MSYISYRILRVHQWTDKDPDEILETYPIVYSHSNPRERVAIENLHNLPMLDDDGNEILIFDVEGQRIPRRTAVGNSTPMGVLAKLRGLDEFLPGYGGTHYQNYDSHVPSMKKKPTYYVYPQAGTMDYGHIQSHIIPDVLLPHIRDINKRVSVPRRRDRVDERDGPVDHSDDGEFAEPSHDPR